LGCGSAEGAASGTATGSPDNWDGRAWRGLPELLYSVARFIRGSFDRFAFEWTSGTIVP
jgi:hypothetical protein